MTTRFPRHSAGIAPPAGDFVSSAKLIRVLERLKKYCHHPVEWQRQPGLLTFGSVSAQLQGLNLRLRERPMIGTTRQKLKIPAPNGYSIFLTALWAITFLVFFLPASNVFGAGLISDTNNNVSLSWNASLDPLVVGYKVLYGTASGDYTSVVLVGNVTSTTISNLQGGTTYYFVVAAYDVYGNQSQNSAEVAFTPGNPRATLQVASGGAANVTVWGVAGELYEIQASQDLKSWTVLGSLTMDDSGSSTFNDGDAVNHLQRFYRIEEVQ